MEKQRKLGNSGISISPVVFGAWAIGGWLWGGSNEKDAIEAIQASLKNGINTIDTAPVYGMGYSEELVAKAIAGNRKNVVIATKCGIRWDTDEGADPWPQKDLQGNDILIRKNSKPASLFKDCEDSLRRLKIDVIDLFQIHWPDPSTPIEESWKAMVKLKQQGKVRAIGVSNYNLQQLKEAHAIHPVDSLQPPFSLIRRDNAKDLIPFCQANNIGVIVYSPLERGMLTGKITMDWKFPEGDHRENYVPFKLENRKKTLDALEKIRPIAERHKATIPQVIVKCTIGLPGITGAIVGARNAEQAISNAQALNLDLSQSEQQEIINILAPINFPNY